MRKTDRLLMMTSTYALFPLLVLVKSFHLSVSSVLLIDNTGDGRLWAVGPTVAHVLRRRDRVLTASHHASASSATRLNLTQLVVKVGAEGTVCLFQFSSENGKRLIETVCRFETAF